MEQQNFNFDYNHEGNDSWENKEKDNALQSYDYNLSKNQPNPIKVNILRAIVIFVLGWIGLSIIYTIVVSIGKAAGITLNYSEDPDSYLYINSIYQVISYSVLFISLIIAVLAPMIKENFQNIIQGWNKKDTYIKAIFFALLLLGWQVIYSVIINMIFGEIGSNNNQSTLVLMAKVNPIAIFIVAVILAPLCEEFTYRYALFGGIYSLGNYFNNKKIFTILSFVLTGLVFGLIHFDFDAISVGGNTLIIELLNLPNYIGAGLILCLAYYKSNSMITPILVHLINNLYSVIGIFIAISGGN